MRIIAGKYRAKVINSPKTDKTRPTLDRVKEALFNILNPYIVDANVLDLFSGTGNLGIEAISRGAKFAWLCVKITKKDYAKCLKQIQGLNLTFDIIFLDPPYDSTLAVDTLKYISDSENILSRDGIIVYETDKNYIKKLEKKDALNELEFKNLECVDTRNYGNVILKLYKWRER